MIAVIIFYIQSCDTKYMVKVLVCVLLVTPHLDTVGYSQHWIEVLKGLLAGNYM